MFLTPIFFTLISITAPALASGISGIATFIAVIVFIVSGFFNIGPGEVGVRFDPWGGGIKQVLYTEGWNFKAPWVSINVYNAKTQVFTMSGVSEEKASLTHSGSIRTTTNEGLYVTLDLTVQYKINSSKAWVIRQTIGTDGMYQDIVVLPQIRSTIRDVVSKYSAAEVYGEGKSKVEKDVYEDLVTKLAPNNIIVEAVLLRDVQLPEQLSKSIDIKKQAEQEALAMEYVLQKAEQEKSRKIIEAAGIAEANKIISGSLTTAYLDWYWIDAMDKNPKVIYIATEGGIPVLNIPID